MSVTDPSPGARPSAGARLPPVAHIEAARQNEGQFGEALYTILYLGTVNGANRRHRANRGFKNFRVFNGPRVSAPTRLTK